MKTLSRGYMVQFTKKSHRYIFLAFTVSNWSMSSPKLVFSKFSFSILRNAKLLRRSSPIEARKSDRINFSLLKDRSHLATDTATVRRIWRQMRRFGNTLFPCATINSSKSDGVLGIFLIRVLSNILQSSTSVNNFSPLTWVLYNNQMYATFTQISVSFLARSIFISSTNPNSVSRSFNLKIYIYISWVKMINHAFHDTNNFFFRCKSGVFCLFFEHPLTSPCSSFNFNAPSLHFA